MSWRLPFFLGCFFFLLAGHTLHAASGTTKAENRLSELSWKRRHARISAEANKGDAEIMFLGDSITQGWANHSVWQKNFAHRKALNAGIGSDRVEHILWRVRHGNFDAVKPKVVVLLAGVNNLALSTPGQIDAGIKSIITEIHQRSPRTKILLLGIFPSGESPNHPRRARIKNTNALLKKQDGSMNVTYLDIGSKFLERDGRIAKSTMHDYLHLTIRGYALWASAMRPTLDRMLAQ